MIGLYRIEEEGNVEIVFSSLFWFYPWRDWKKKKLNCRRFNPREAAYAFLRQYNQENFVRGQKVISEDSQSPLIFPP